MDASVLGWADDKRRMNFCFELVEVVPLYKSVLLLGVLIVHRAKVPVGMNRALDGIIICAVEHKIKWPSRAKQGVIHH